MNEKTLQRLKIDRGFKDLISPLSRQEYLQLEENIIEDGCRDPITVWNGCIVDGHNRYEICRRHRIPFQIVEMNFNSREEAVQWICKNQLGRRNITEETRRYLIGIQYESEKIISQQRNKGGRNQYYPQAPETDDLNTQEETGELEKSAKAKNPTAERIAKDNHISHSTVQKYGQYSRAIDAIRKKCPELYPKILSGSFKISHENLIELSSHSASSIRNMVKNMEVSEESTVSYKEAREQLMKTDQKSTGGTAPSIKDMPKYDPDAEVISLSLTIPAWVSSLNRTSEKASFDKISDKTRAKLSASLRELYIKALEVLVKVEEK